MNSTEDKIQQYCTFYVAHLMLGIEVLSVQEVLRGSDLTPVPLADTSIEGLLNLRGQIVTAIDLRRRLGLPSIMEEASSMLLVVRDGEGVVAFRADSVGDVIDVDESTIHAPPGKSSHEFQNLISGVYQLPDCLLHILDTDGCAAVAS